MNLKIKYGGLACYMIEKEKQDICKNELYEACSKLQCELGTYADYLSNFFMLVEESFMTVPIIDPEASDYIERCIHVLSEYYNRTEGLIRILNDYINHCMKDAENEDLNICVEQSEKLIKGIFENYPPESDILYLKNMILDCQRIIDRVCNQKWQGGESRFERNTTFYLVERHEQLQGLLERVKYLLNSYINELNRYLHRHTWGLTP